MTFVSCAIFLLILWCRSGKRFWLVADAMFAGCTRTKGCVVLPLAVLCFSLPSRVGVVCSTAVQDRTEGESV